MKKYFIIGVSTIIVVFLIVGSLNNIVGYQTIQASNQKFINNEIDPKELLFRTIIDLTNNREIKKVIFISEMKDKQFIDSNTKFSIFDSTVLTEKSLKQLFSIGVMLSKTLSVSRVNSILIKYQIRNQNIQKEISNVIKKDVKLSGELMQLSNVKCDCEGKNMSPSWTFFILCIILMPILYVVLMIYLASHFTIFENLLSVLMGITYYLNCWH
jgi:hypothetical protein